jgi:aspartate aminotransferase
MMKSTAVRVGALPPSATLALMDRTRALRKQGLDVISFGPGEPDFDTPAHIIEAGVKSMRSGFTHYVSSRGIPELLDSIASHLATGNGITVDPRKEIIVTPGSNIAIFISLVGLLDPGDEVLILEPAWVAYDPMVSIALGKPIRVPLNWQSGFRIERQQIEALISPRTKAIILNSPNNPTGRIISLGELEVVERLANQYDFYVICDEIYNRITYDAPSISPASLPGLRKRTLTTNGFSKAYAMTGWRLGYVAGDEELISQILRVQQHVVTCATSFVQAAGVAALNGPQEPVEDMVRQYRRRRDLIMGFLDNMPGVKYTVPTGAFYFFIRFQRPHMSSQEIAERLLEESLVAVTPGTAFGEAGEGHLRLSYACALEDIEVGMKRMLEFFREHA